MCAVPCSGVCARVHVHSAKAPSGWVLSTDQDEEGEGSSAAFQNRERAWVTATLDAASQREWMSEILHLVFSCASEQNQAEISF